LRLCRSAFLLTFISFGIGVSSLGWLADPTSGP
jgi:hypothetical protein